MLMQDAVALVAEMLAAELSGAAEVSPDGKRLSLRIISSGEDDAAVPPLTYELPLSARVHWQAMR